MGTIISAVVGELVSRSISFLINRYLKPASTKEESIQRLKWMLMRIHITVKEAEGRHITNQAMLQQMNILREVMYKGYYMLDTFMQQHQEEEKHYDHGASRSLSLSKFNPAKRVCFSSQSKHDVERIEDMLQCVATAISSMSEFVIFLRNYPPMFRQPYSTYLFIGNCMFGRQVEMERVTNFLLYEEHPAVSGNIGVLPIVGPRKAGKTTLVEHICRDERVRNHFSCIILISSYDFKEERECNFRDQGRIKHQNDDSNEEKELIIVEVDGNVDEGAWTRSYSAYLCSAPRSSKIIITSRSKDIINFGTTQALSLNFLSREAHWYFFKALLFGSADSEEQPKLSSIAVTILDEYFDQGIYTPFSGPFINLNNTANLLKANPGAHNWLKILQCIRENRQQNEHLSSKGFSNFRSANDHIYFRRLTETTQYCVVDSHDRIAHDDEEAPNISLTEIIAANVTPRGKFEVLVWKSHLPPYYQYIYRCEILEFEGKQDRKRKYLR